MGIISLNNFYGQQKRDTTLVSFPPALSNFKTYTGVDLFNRSFENVEPSNLLQDGFVYVGSNFASSLGIRWGGGGSVTLPPVSGMSNGVGLVSMTFQPTNLEGGETAAIDGYDGKSNILLWSGTVSNYVTSTIDIDLRGTSNINFYSSNMTFTLRTTGFGPSDIMNFTSAQIKSAEVYHTMASTSRDTTLPSWGTFNGLSVTDPYDNKWQSADNTYDSNTGNAISSVTFNGYTPPDLGQWIGLTTPYPMYLQSYMVSGNLVNFKLYGSINPTNTSSWVMIDSRTGRSGVYTDENTYTLSSTTSNAYITFIIQILKVSSPPGYGRCGMRKILFNGYRA